jgi:hypothetical protein
MPGPFSAENFGDGSNEWIPGIVETVKNPVDRARNPYDTLAGAADAAALNFDEGVGGIVSVFDGQPGNTAGPGQSPFLEEPRDGQPENPTAGTPLAGLVWIVVAVLVVGAALWLLRPLLTIGAEVVAE